jgi:hypothetical protein
LGAVLPITAAVFDVFVESFSQEGKRETKKSVIII